VEGSSCGLLRGNAKNYIKSWEYSASYPRLKIVISQIQVKGTNLYNNMHMHIYEWACMLTFVYTSTLVCTHACMQTHVHILHSNGLQAALVKIYSTTLMVNAARATVQNQCLWCSIFLCQQHSTAKANKEVMILEEFERNSNT
jgi:hypothetical protein